MLPPMIGQAIALPGAAIGSHLAGGSDRDHLIPLLPYHELEPLKPITESDLISCWQMLRAMPMIEREGATGGC